MKNFEFYIKKILKNTFTKVVLTSLITVVVTLVIVIGLVWFFKDEIFKVISQNYFTNQQLLADENKVPEESKKEDNNKVSLPKTITQENTVVGAVKKAQPAVVSIIVTKTVPKYEVSYDQNNIFDQFGDFFPDLYFQTPSYKQNGTEEKEVGAGSGFLISADGLIVTNRHVVAQTDANYTVYLNNGKEYKAEVLARDPVLDVALVKINMTNLPYLKLADSDQLEVGETVIAIGNALGEFKNSVSVGIVSGLSRSLVAGDNFGRKETLDKVIQTDAAINPGNSGGPLLNLSGTVVGINVAVVQGSENIGFALPINSVKTVIDSFKNTGKIIRPYVGIRYIPVTPELKSKNNLIVNYGILVLRGESSEELAVIPGSPADKAGILENDIILEIDGEKIDSDKNFSSIIRAKKVGDYITMKILSKGIEKTVFLKLEQAPDNL